MYYDELLKQVEEVEDTLMKLMNDHDRAIHELLQHFTDMVDMIVIDDDFVRYNNHCTCQHRIYCIEKIRHFDMFLLQVTVLV